MYAFTKGQELFIRSAAVIPSGIDGHQTPLVLVPGAYPLGRRPHVSGVAAHP